MSIEKSCKSVLKPHRERKRDDSGRTLDFERNPDIHTTAHPLHRGLQIAVFTGNVIVVEPQSQLGCGPSRIVKSGLLPVAANVRSWHQPPAGGLVRDKSLRNRCITDTQPIGNVFLLLRQIGERAHRYAGSIKQPQICLTAAQSEIGVQFFARDYSILA